MYCTSILKKVPFDALDDTTLERNTLMSPSCKFVVFIQKATAPPAAPHVSGRAMQASSKIPRSTHCSFV